MRAALEDLRAGLAAADGVSATIHEDDSNMTPMLAVTFDRGAERSGVLRDLFHAEGPVAVDSIYDRKVVVRGQAD